MYTWDTKPCGHSHTGSTFLMDTIHKLQFKNVSVTPGLNQSSNPVWFCLTICGGPAIL